MATAPVSETIIAEHVVIYDVSWEAYEQLLTVFGDRRLRHSYDDGTLEIMSPLKRHDRAKTIIGRLIETAALELDIDIQSIGSTTLRRRPRRKGLEPDECYYVQHEAQVRHEEDYEPERDPPPDLAIEVDVEHSSLSRLEIYAGLGVPEVWRFADDILTFLRLRRGKYVSMPRSAAFPQLTSRILQQLVARRWEFSENQLIREFISWLRKSK